MNLTEDFIGKTIGVVGFNARPIACSLKRLGARVIVSDYWGDEDLDTCCDSWEALLSPTPGKRPRQPLDLPLPDALVRNMSLLMKSENLDHIVVGSGFDDHSNALDLLSKEGLLLGNSPVQMDMARDRKLLFQIAAKSGINVPYCGTAWSAEDALAIASKIGFPVVVRPPISGGGSGIRFAMNDIDLRKLMQKEEERLIQQYIPGIDFSSSIMCNGADATILSIQGQLVGMPSAGRNCDFAYCGNYLPLTLVQAHRNTIKSFAGNLTKKIGLLGSNGIDFVIDSKNHIWLMEVNPRVQGTLELLEMASSKSIMAMHYDACESGHLPEKIEFQSGVKMIVYARQDMAVPDLSAFSNTLDRSPEDVVVSAGDPICTIIEVGSELKPCYQRVIATSNQIQHP